jgi:hypothetical protein
MATFPFLSDEWVSEARKIREEYEGKGAVVPHQMKMNLNVTEVPFGHREPSRPIWTRATGP